jgi:crotonobetainyl-CoA:carnitine CoA-transferase CaiB-like acyl-CoA transferase
VSDDRNTRAFAATIGTAVGLDPAALERVESAGTGSLPSVFAVSDFATAAVATAAVALSELMRVRFDVTPRVTVDRRMASLWFGWTFQPQGWKPATLWDAVAGDYVCADGWIRLHTNAPHHRDAALAVLGVPADRDAVARAVRTWKAQDLETAVVQNKGCAAAMRGIEQWAAHPQGRIVPAQPLVHWSLADATDSSGGMHATIERPLRGIRVLDLTRVLAGPVATRFLAGFGADVLRLDPPGWDEPGAIPEVALGKRCARLDLREHAGRATFTDLLREADVLVHGYRANALEHLGLGAAERRRIRPGLVDVSLNAYGWDGPWRNRRGFDSLVQMSSGIADAGMRTLSKERPTPLPVQALDHATGYVMAAAVLRGLTERATSGRGCEARTALAYAAHALVHGPAARSSAEFPPAAEDEWSPGIEHTGFGQARRLRPPMSVEGAPMRWDLPAPRLGSAAPAWTSDG